MSDSISRPFDDEYAWVYDLIIPPPSEAQFAFIAGAAGRARSWSRA